MLLPDGDWAWKVSRGQGMHIVPRNVALTHSLSPVRVCVCVCVCVCVVLRGWQCSVRRSSAVGVCVSGRGGGGGMCLK